MESLIKQSIESGIAYLKATNFSSEAWIVIIKNAMTLGNDVANKIIDGINEGLK
jgi:hypothetical protein